MTNIIEITEAIKNGIEYLEEERWFGRGTELHQAIQKMRIARLGGNEQAAIYWGKVAAACRKLEQITAKTNILIAA